MSKAKIYFGIIIVVIIAFALYSSGILKNLAFSLPFSFVGFTFTDYGNQFQGSCGSSGSSDVKLNNLGFMEITASGKGIERHAKTDITGNDEILIIYEGYAAASCSLGYSNSGAGIGANILGENLVSASSSELSSTAILGAGKSIGTSTCPSSSGSVSTAFQPAIWKFKNNYDGTWSSLEGIGVGDVYIERLRLAIPAGKVYLDLFASVGCTIGGSGNSYLKVYNIVRKNNGFAICKADEYLTTDSTGKQVCASFSSIVLNSEEAIKEDYNAKIARIEAELQQKNDYLNAQIIQLQQQLSQQQSTNQLTLLQQQITALQNQLATASDKSLIQAQIDELRKQQLSSSNLNDRISVLQVQLDATKKVLDAVIARDQAVINAADLNMKFQQPNLIQRWISAIIAFFKNIFN